MSNIWASLPGAGYYQREQKLENRLAYYRRNLGACVAATASSQLIAPVSSRFDMVIALKYSL
ncbi:MULTISPECIES: lysozyme family protein [Xanthomonas translucens group]|uniref:hypothetical protein n=1 Tax=Xanthomonas translucens group TaxID=3390202 RepID=UPI000A84F9B1